MMTYVVKSQDVAEMMLFYANPLWKQGMTNEKVKQAIKL